MISLTERAEEILRGFLQGEDGQLFLRLKAQGSGCSGYRYAISIEASPRKRDVVVEYVGFAVRMEEKAFILLKGSLLDYDEEEGALKIITTQPQSGCSTCQLDKTAAPGAPITI